MMDSGSATPLVVGLVAVVTALAMALSLVGSGLVASARAGGAAQLAALAAAQVDRDQRALGASSAAALRVACVTAREVARHNGTTLTGCVRAVGSSVIVTVSAPVPAARAHLESSARAGPAWG